MLEKSTVYDAASMRSKQLGITTEAGAGQPRSIAGEWSTSDQQRASDRVCEHERHARVRQMAQTRKYWQRSSTGRLRLLFLLLLLLLLPLQGLTGRGPLSGSSVA